ncbi:hypothetical protein M1N47_01470 [Dehalococcoidia bacterium]|nr:hypothetical protein [Dehalococcoidia bacterium]
MAPEQFEESLKEIEPRVFMNGKRVENILENRNTRTVVEANKASYSWALDPRYRDIMTCYSPLIDDVVNRYTYVSAGIEDLVKRQRRERLLLRCWGRAYTAAWAMMHFIPWPVPPGKWTRT